VPDYDNGWWTAVRRGNQGIDDGQHQIWVDNLEAGRWVAEETEYKSETDDEPIKRKRRKKRIVKKKVKPHSPNNHFRRIQLLIECQCKRPRICKRTACSHYGVHIFDKDKCGKRVCNFTKIETARIGGLRGKNGKEILGKPFKVKSNVERHVSCKITEEKYG